MRVGLLIILAGLFLVSGCQPQPASWLEPLPTSTSSGYSSPGDLFSVYFTAPSPGDFRGGPDRNLVDALDESRVKIDAALYDLNLWSVRNALLRAHDRGVVIRLVLDDGALDRPEVQELIAAGIPVKVDGEESLMHNKFIIIDGSEVWTGSMNMTINGAYRHLNNLLRLRSSRLAENYTVEFEEMFLEGYFGELVLANTPHSQLTLDGVLIETYFSPDDGTEDRIIHLIQEAEKNIDFMFYSFTSDPAGDALIAQAQHGIQIRGVVDAYQEGAGLGGEYTRLKDAGLSIYLDSHPEKLHHKVLIIDQQIVVTGSYNLTRSAGTKNDENTLIIHDQNLAQIFLGEFEWIYQAAADR
jgi:phosphatidylserine/phosphatidylglycerophosphate/cardiolipin synthase-like enzyme